jgi:pyruvate dehydrogenase E2 component (dihydrolipoamide acetyltransferase)
MEKSLTMPKLGMTMTEGTVLRWLYQEGDLVVKGEPIVEVMTDKVNMEVEAPFGGRLMHILAHDGDVLPIGAPLATLIDGVEVNNAAKQSLTQVTSSVNTTTLIPIPSTPAAKREALLRGIDLQAVVQSGATPPLDRTDILAFVQSTGDTTQPEARTIRATPVAQKIALEHQIDLAELAERKAGGKVTRADVETHLAQSRKQEMPQIKEEQVVTLQSQDDERIPVSPVRRLIGQRMQQSVITAPHIYLDTEIDMTEAERYRQRVGRSLREQGEPVPSLTAILIRVVAAALVLHPEVNATLEPWVPVAGSSEKDVIHKWRDVHIGVAVDTERALLTPVIRNAQQQSIPSLGRELRRISQAARENKLKPDDMANATFTISNLGMYGIDTFHAIIAPGQSAILAVGKVTKRGVVVEDEKGERLEIRPIMKVSLSADHRVLDGASGSRFLHRIKTFLEDPYLLL